MIELRPIIPELQAIVLVLGILALAVWMHMRDAGRNLMGWLLFVPRLLVLTAFALLILNPVRRLPAEKPKGKTPILVLVDTSHSMTIKDVDGAARIEAVRKALFRPEVAEALSKNNAPKYFGFAGDASAKVPEELAKPGPVNGSHTYIGDSLVGAVSAAGGTQSGGILLISDGRDNGEMGPIEVAKQLRTRGFSVFTVCVGTESKTKDVSVSMTRPQVFGSPDQEVTLSADVSSTGYGSVPVQVRLLRDGIGAGEKTVQLRPDGHTEVKFTVKESKKGSYRYSIESVPLPDEVTAANNRASCLLTIGNATTQVLVLEGKPTWEAKFLTETLRTDPSLSVDCVFQLTSTRAFALQGLNVTEGSQSEVTVPKTRPEFAKYDVVIIGKGFEEFFDDKSAKALEEYVSRDGGHLIFLRGPAATDNQLLADLDPVAWDPDQIHDFRMEVTQDGAANPAFGFGGSDPGAIIQRLPTLISATRVSKEKALSVVLARAAGTTNSEQPNLEMALLAYVRHGDGLVVSLVGQGLWRWAMLPPDLSDYSKCYTDFWTQLVRWTVDQSDFLPGQDLVLRTDHYAYSPGEGVNLTCFSRGTSRVPLTTASIMGPDGHEYHVSLAKAKGFAGDFSGTFKPKVPGDYVATVVRPGKRGGQVTAPFSVLERREEDMNTAADPALMASIAKAGGGRALALDEIKDLPRLIEESHAWQPNLPEPQSVWDSWQVLAAILGLLSLEWIMRRRVGLV